MQRVPACAGREAERQESKKARYLGSCFLLSSLGWGALRVREEEAGQELALWKEEDASSSKPHLVELRSRQMLW